MKIVLKKLKLRQLMPQQEQYISWASPLVHVACFMEMRLGKTLANIRLVNLWAKKDGPERSANPRLVVAPLSVLEAWEKELSLEGERYIIPHGMSLDKRIDLVVHEAYNQKYPVWVLINYEGLRCTPGLVNIPWYVVILDESGAIKNAESKISHLITSGFSYDEEPDHKIILDGAPNLEGELGLYQGFKFLHGKFMNCDSYWKYRAKLFEIKWDGWRPKPGMKVAIKEEAHRRSFIMTRKQAGMGAVEVQETRVVKINKQQLAAYTRVEKEFVAIIDRDGYDKEVETDHVISSRIWMSRIAGGCDIEGNPMKGWDGKVRELLYLLKGDLKNQPVVVWFRFDAEIWMVAEELRAANIHFTTLTGEDSREERKRKQEEFRKSKVKSRVILVQIKKIAEYGVDMSVSDTAIYYSVTYSGKEMAQTKARIQHPLKKTPLLYLYLATEGTIDEDAIEIVKDKIIDNKVFMGRMRDKFLKRNGISLNDGKHRPRQSKTD